MNFTLNSKSAIIVCLLGNYMYFFKRLFKKIFANFECYSEVRIKQGSSYVTLSRTADNFFVSAGDVSFPLPDTVDIQVVSIEGEVLNDRVIILIFFSNIQQTHSFIA